LSGLAPVLGALSVGATDLFTLFILFCIGLCTHIFGFTFNEYVDLEIDRKAKILSNKPLVKGTISKSSALIFAFSGVIIGYLLLIYLHLKTPISLQFGFLFYTLAWLSIGVYDLTSKNIRGSDIALALWTCTLCLFGGFAITDRPEMLLFIIAGLAFFQLLIQNILAGLKDLAQDSEGLGTTTPLRLGVKLKIGRLSLPIKFQILIYALKIIHLTLVFIPFILLWFAVNYFQIIFILLLLIINFILVFRIFNSIHYSRNTLMRTIGLHEIISYSIVPVLLIGIIGIQTTIFLIIFPMIWLALFLKLLYGQLLPNI
jgi:4-hydroxybenzoate polyprenyltransferase